MVLTNNGDGNVVEFTLLTMLAFLSEINEFNIGVARVSGRPCTAFYYDKAIPLRVTSVNN